MTAPGKAGRAAIWSEVVRQRGLIRGVLLRYRVPECDLDDLEQTCMFVAWRRIEEGAFNPPDPTKPLALNVAAWLGGIARWVAIEHKRAQARQAKVFAQQTREHPVDVDALAVPGPEAQILAREELEAIARLKMKPMQRQAVAMAAEGYTAREIGERLGVPEDTAATYLKRARKALAKRRHG